jgi:hypothetical protein
MLTVEVTHRRHAIIEQVHADLKGGPLAHLPSRLFAANSAWLVLATMAGNLTRASGALASTFHAKANTATLRAQLITVAARVATSARCTTLHQPTAWPWAQQWQRLFTAAIGAPPTPRHRPPPTGQPETTVDTPSRPEAPSRPETDQPAEDY